MSAPSNGGAPLGIPLELRDEAAILNFIFSNSSIAFAPPPLPPAPAPAPAPAAPPAAPTDAADRFAADLEAHARWNDREAAAVAAAEDGRQDEARAILDDVCAQAPGRASGFNNRAQLRRLASDAAGAKADLDAAVRLAQAWLAAHEAGGHPLAEFHRGVLRAALTQRAAWWHAAGKPDEEMDDLSAAAAAGSALARMLATKVSGGCCDARRGRGGATLRGRLASTQSRCRHQPAKLRPILCNRDPRLPCSRTAVQPVRHHVPGGGQRDAGQRDGRGRRCSKWRRGSRRRGRGGAVRCSGRRGQQQQRRCSSCASQHQRQRQHLRCTRVPRGCIAAASLSSFITRVSIGPGTCTCATARRTWNTRPPRHGHLCDRMCARVGCRRSHDGQRVPHNR